MAAIVLVALLGLGFHLFSKEGRRFRFLGVVFLTVFGILFWGVGTPGSRRSFGSAESWTTTASTTAT